MKKIAEETCPSASPRYGVHWNVFWLFYGVGRRQRDREKTGGDSISYSSCKFVWFLLCFVVVFLSQLR